MKSLYIYPTSRAIRKQKEILRVENALMPSLMRIDEFEKRAVLLPNLTMVDKLQRILILQKASQFNTFNNLKIDRELVKFFIKSDAILKFFEELSHEEVSFDDLIDGDSFVEFTEQIEILQKLLENYEKLLYQEGLTDRVFLPKLYRLNSGFIDEYNKFELFLEGYMSRFELSLIEKIAQQKKFIIHLQTSRFNKKIQSRFLEMGVEELPMDSFVSFDLHTKRIISSKKNSKTVKAKVFSVEERLAQIPLLFESIQQMVDGGIAPENIAVILPDESFKDTIKLYDSFNNLNFAMGFNFSHNKDYKILEAIYGYWSDFFSRESKKNLLKENYSIDMSILENVNHYNKMEIDEFFHLLNSLGFDFTKEITNQTYLQFKFLFKREKMSLKHFLFLWLKTLKQLTIDDVRGGKVTVMGALETRGVSFRGVIILDFNDGIVPSIPAKDAFLNSSIRKSANLPTKNDREALQKQIYKRVLEEADKAVIIYSQSNHKSPASYLYELGLGIGEEREVNLKLLYNQRSQIIDDHNPTIKNFNAQNIIWSATKLNIFLSCKRKYYYLYEKRLKAKESEELNEGLFLHKLLEHLFKNHNSFNDFKTMQRDIENLLNTLLDTLSAKIAYSKLLWKAKLTKFIEQQIAHFKKGWRVLETERRVIGEIGGLKFEGKIDRIDTDGSNILVVDYKTGSIVEANRVKNLSRLKDFQMSIYSELLKPYYSNIHLVFIELFKGKMTPITELKTKTQMLYGIIEELKGLKEIEAVRCEDISKCQYCDYTLLCQRGEYL